MNLFECKNKYKYKLNVKTNDIWWNIRIYYLKPSHHFQTSKPQLLQYIWSWRTKLKPIKTTKLKINIENIQDRNRISEIYFSSWKM